MIGTIGAAQYACFTGVRIPWSNNLLSSASTKDLIAYGTDRALKKCGGTVGLTKLSWL